MAITDVSESYLSNDNPVRSSFVLLYIVIVVIILFNVLIAMMGDTYGKFMEEASERYMMEKQHIMEAMIEEFGMQSIINQKFCPYILQNYEMYLQIERENSNASSTSGFDYLG